MRCPDFKGWEGHTQGSREGKRCPVYQSVLVSWSPDWRVSTTCIYTYRISGVGHRVKWSNSQRILVQHVEICVILCVELNNISG